MKAECKENMNLRFRECVYNMGTYLWNSYFIQLTNKAVKTLFDVSVSEPLFDETIPSLLSEDKCTPAFLCPLGIKRMAEDFIKFPEQYEINISSMKKEDLVLTGWDLLEQEYNNLKSERG